MTEKTARGRLTPVDIVFYGVAVFLVGQLSVPIYTVLSNNAGEMGTGTAYLFQMVFPGLVMTILIVVYLTGATGGSA